METFERPKNEEEFFKQAGMIGRIGLREGISPQVLNLFIIDGHFKFS